MVSDEGHPCLGEDPDQVLTLYLFFQGIPTHSWDFPSVVNRSQSVSTAAKQDFAAAKYTHN